MFLVQTFPCTWGWRGVSGPLHVLCCLFSNTPNNITNFGTNRINFNAHGNDFGAFILAPLETIGKLRGSLVFFANLWKFLATLDNSWQPMANIGSPWPTLATFGKPWQPWQLLSTFGKPWRPLATLGNLWQTLATFDNLW